MFSKANSTWSKHCAAWALLNEFQSKNTCNWPMTMADIRCFVIWALQIKNLKHSTVKSYISSIRLAHTLGELECPNFSKDDIVKMALTGASNIEQLSNCTSKIRPAMTINSLLVFGHKLAATDWQPYSKQVVWAASLVSFFTSCRMGELLPAYTCTHDKNTTLLWKHVTFYEDYATIYIPYTKTKGLAGHALDIFTFQENTCCPFSALLNLKNMSVKEGVNSSSTPVFSFLSGKNLTVKKLNEILEKMLGTLGKSSSKFTCHSFRAAIPSVIARHPDKSHTSDIMDWGEWTSPSYNLYTKFTLERKKFLFNKISGLLCDSM